MTDLPMFPLGSVLVPGAPLPLHVFEPRYRTLVEHVLASDGRFGVVLIERGHEVGGGDVRMDVGTVARILRSEQLEDGRWLIVAVGTERIRVREWLPDDPYPRADVEPWPDDEVDVPPDLVADVATRLVRVHALGSELGLPPVGVDLSPDPWEASHQAVAYAPIGPLDAHELLAAPDARTRLERLRTRLDDEIDVRRRQLATEQ